MPYYGISSPVKDFPVFRYYTKVNIYFLSNVLILARVESSKIDNTVV